MERTITNKVYYSPSENVYENTILIAKRARQVVLQRSADFAAESEEFNGEERVEDIIQDTTYQERIAKKYEKLPKPIAVAKQDVQEGNIRYRYSDTDLEHL